MKTTLLLTPVQMTTPQTSYITLTMTINASVMTTPDTPATKRNAGEIEAYFEIFFHDMYPDIKKMIVYQGA